MTTILLIRHGQTAWNREERLRGQVDLPLDAVGHQQAQAIAWRVASHWRPAAIYASSLQRTLQTAAPIAHAVGLQTVVHDGLLDIDYGDCAGLSQEELEARYPDQAAAWRQAPDTVHFPDGESLANVRDRAEETVVEAVGKHPDDVVVLVTHVVVCRLLLCSMLSLDSNHFWQFEPATASLSVLDLSPEANVLVSLNDTCHLSALSDQPSAVSS
jgi:probable phosphoglycerate mutase